ncbi:MAG TPA: hypothetical protein VGB18_01170 [Candidatus Thermoplasmatota archaeon]
MVATTMRAVVANNDPSDTMCDVAPDTSMDERWFAPAAGPLAMLLILAVAVAARQRLAGEKP